MEVAVLDSFDEDKEDDGGQFEEVLAQRVSGFVAANYGSTGDSALAAAVRECVRQPNRPTPTPALSPGPTPVHPSYS